MYNGTPSKSKQMYKNAGCFYAFLIAFAFFVAGFAAHEAFNNYALPDMLERQYYRAQYDVCMQAIRDEDACFSRVRQLQHSQWYEQNSPGFKWPLPKYIINNNDGRSG